jgi:hypothetical protein
LESKRIRWSYVARRRAGFKLAEQKETAAAKPARAAAKAAAKPATKVASPRTKEPVAKPESHDVQIGYLSDFIGFHLRLAQDASYRTFARHSEKDLIKPGRFAALAIIHLNPGISQSALGRAIARDKSTVSPHQGPAEERLHLAQALGARPPQRHALADQEGRAHA